MNCSPPPLSLSGIFPPLVTPLKAESDSLDIDVDGLHRLLEHVLAGSVTGVFALGTTGETASLTPRLRREMVEATCQIVAGQAPVLVGITDTCLEQSLELADVAHQAGAACLVAAPPYYYPSSQDELLGYYQRLLQDLPLPLLLYNIPSCTKTSLDVETVCHLADHPQVVGMKDSSRDWDFFRQLLDSLGGRDDFSLLVGPEVLLSRAVQAGATGGICGGANMHPSLYVQLYEAAVAKDPQRVAELHSVVERIGETIYSVSDSPARLIQTIKAALRCLNICNDTMAAPLVSLDEEHREQVRQHLEALGITSAPA